MRMLQVKIGEGDGLLNAEKPGLRPGSMMSYDDALSKACNLFVGLLLFLSLVFMLLLICILILLLIIIPLSSCNIGDNNLLM